MKKGFELTTVRINRDLRKRIRKLSKSNEISQGAVIRQLLRIGERHFTRKKLTRV
jgi:hypothetical protein